MAISMIQAVSNYSASKSATKVQVQAASKSWIGEAWDWLVGNDDADSMRSYIEISNRVPTATVSACDSWDNNPQAQNVDGGTTIDIPPSVDGGLDVDEHHNPIVNEDTFPISGTGGQFRFSPNVSWTSGFLSTTGLQNTPVYVQVGLDPTVITNPDLSGQCFDGLIDTTPISGDDVACYENLLACPNDPASRMPVYLAEVTIDGFRWNSETNGWDQIAVDDSKKHFTFVSPDMIVDEHFDFNSLDGMKLGVFCAPGTNDPAVDAYGNPIIVKTVSGSIGQIPVPAEYHADGELMIQITTRFLTNGWAQSENQSYTYESRAFVKLYIPEA